MMTNKKYEMPLEKRQNMIDEIKTLKVLLGLEAGELSEGQASTFLAIQRVSLRQKRADFIAEIVQEIE
jgi:hypothetical protein